MGNSTKIDLSILERLSPRDRIYSTMETNRIIDNVIGFIPASDCCDNAILITNLAVLLAEKGYTTCILDHKIFYPSLYKLLDCEAKPAGRGLINLLRSDKIDFREEIDATAYKNLYLLSPSPSDSLEDYFDFQIADIKRIVSTLRDMFDIVLIDIPNIPPLEFCFASVKYSNIGFFVWSQRIDCPQNTSKFLDFITSTGQGASKFTNIVLNNMTEIPYDCEIVGEMGMRLAAQIPYIPKTIDCALEGKVYIKHTRLIDRRYENALYKLVDIILR